MRGSAHLSAARILTLGLLTALTSLTQIPAKAAPALSAGLAKVDISPGLPIRLAGYAGRKRPADKSDHPLLAQALAFKNPTGETFVMVAVDNCELSAGFLAPVLEDLHAELKLPPGAIAIVSSHTHSAPVVTQTLVGMPVSDAADQERVIAYSKLLRAKLAEVVRAAMSQFEPVELEYGVGQAGFGMNRRVYQSDRVAFGDNPDGPVDREVPVLRLRGTNGAVRAVLFGFACHGTSVRTGDDWYTVSGEYMAYAREQVEAVEPGAMAVYVPGFGADIDPSPRGPLLAAKQHGLELAGAVVGVLNRPMRKVQGPLRFVHEQVELPLSDPPSPEQIKQDAESKDIAVRERADVYLKLLERGAPLPASVKLPATVLRFGDDLTFVLLGGEVVVDYSRKLKRLLRDEHPWLVAYAYDVPCYIPSFRIIREGGYEAESSLTYYGLYGPFKPAIEEILLQRVQQMVSALKSHH